MIELILGVGALLYFTRAKKVTPGPGATGPANQVPGDVPQYRTNDQLPDRGTGRNSGGTPGQTGATTNNNRPGRPTNAL